MDLEPTEDQLALVEELRRLLTARVTPEMRWATAELPGAVDRALWHELAAMGVFGLPVPEADGGVGLGWVEAALALQALGRSIAPGPLVATAAAVACRLADSDDVVGVVPAAPTFVEHLDALDVLLVVDGDTVRRVDPRAVVGGPVARPLDPLTPVHLVDALPGGDVVGEAAPLRRAIALLAAAMHVGLGQAAVDLGAGYATQREQFGRVIGSFQAVKHLLADAVVAVEVARAAVDAAAVTVDEAGDADRAVASARVTASSAAMRAATACIQVHGGMGYTWELDAHLLLKRAHVLDQLGSTVDDAVEVLAGAV